MAYCYATGGSVTSWGRTEKRNSLVSGHPQSYHLHWLGADVVYDETPKLEFRNSVARRHNIRVVPEDDHDHLQAT